MKTLTIQALIQQQWRDIATLQLLSPEKGIASPSRLGYEFEYSVKWLASGVPERILEAIQAKWLETTLTRWGLL